jgi:hypothetical protein
MNELTTDEAAAWRAGAEAMREAAALVALRIEVPEDAGPVDGHARVMASVQIAFEIRALALPEPPHHLQKEQAA